MINKVPGISILTFLLSICVTGSSIAQETYTWKHFSSMSGEIGIKHNTFKALVNDDIDEDNDGITNSDEGACLSMTPSLIYSNTASAIGQNYPALDLTIPDGRGRLLLVQVIMERDHTPVPYGDNWPLSNFNDINSIPSLLLGEQRLEDYGWQYSFMSNAADTARSEALKSLHTYGYYTWLNDEIDYENLSLDFSNYPMPLNAGDESAISVIVIDSVRSLQFDKYGREEGGNSDEWSIYVDPESTNQTPLTSASDNLMIIQTATTLEHKIPIPNGWTEGTSGVVMNSDGTFVTDTAVTEVEYYSENDGLSYASVYRNGVTAPTEVSFKIPMQSIYAKHAVSYRLIGCSSRDTDADGIADYLDNDSDNDGCPDALEGSLTFDMSDVNEQGELIGDQDENGIPLLAVGGQKIGMSINPYQIDKACLTLENCNNNIDDDGDGFIDCEDEDCDCFPCGKNDYDGDQVNDACDKDDDNDGILDTQECPSTFLTINRQDIWTPINGGDTINVQLGDVFVIPSHYIDDEGIEYDLRFELLTKFSSNDAMDFDVKLNPFICIPNAVALYNDHITYEISWVQHGSVTLENLKGEDAVFDWAEITVRDIDNNAPDQAPNYTDVGNFINDVNNIDVGSRLSSYYYPNGQKIYGLTDLTIEQSNCEGCFVEGAIQNFKKSVLLHGVYGTRPPNRRVNRLANWSFRIGNCPDYDKDGIPDYHDYDSDNDSCLDAIEGTSSLIKLEDIANNRIYGSVNPENGISDLLPFGQGVGRSINELLQDSACEFDTIPCQNIDVISFEFTDSGISPTEPGIEWSENGYKMKVPEGGVVFFTDISTFPSNSLFASPGLDLDLGDKIVSRIELDILDFCSFNEEPTIAYLANRNDTSRSPINPPGIVNYILDINLTNESTLTFEIPEGTTGNEVLIFRNCFEMIISEIRLCTIADKLTEEICDNGIDDDGDGFTDCADEDLAMNCCCRTINETFVYNDVTICQGDSTLIKIDRNFTSPRISGLTNNNSVIDIAELYEFWISEAGTFVVSAFDSCQDKMIRDTFGLMNKDIISKDTLVSICPGSTFSLFGIDYNQEGVYNIDTAPNITDCGSSLSLNLSFYPSMDESFSDSICLGQSATFFNTNYSTAGRYTQNFTDSNGCQSERIIDILSKSCDTCMAMTIDTSIVSCPDDTVMFNQAMYFDQGIYQQDIIDEQGCLTTYSLNLSYYPRQSDYILDSLCTGDSMIIANQLFINSGLFSQSYLDANGCDATRTIEVRDMDCDICPEPAERINVNFSLCKFDTLIYLDRSFNEAGIYEVQSTDTSGCAVTHVIEIEVAELRSLDTTLFLCSGDTLQFMKQSYFEEGLYSYSETDGGSCPIQVTLEIIPQGKQIYIDTTIDMCIGDEIKLYSQTYTKSGNFTHLLESESSCDTVVSVIVTTQDCYNHCCSRMGNHIISVTKTSSKSNNVLITSAINRNVVLFSGAIPDDEIKLIFEAFSLIENNYEESNELKREIIRTVIKGKKANDKTVILTNFDTHDHLFEFLNYQYGNLKVGEIFKL